MIVADLAVARHAGGIAARLRGAGVGAGDVVAVLAGNHAGFIAARDAVTAVGAMLAPINPRLAADEVAWILAHARPRAVLVDRAHAAALASTPPVMVIDDVEPGAAADRAGIGATLLYTSGTTGRPKGCVRPEAAEEARAAELTATYGLGPGDVHLIACPLAHSAPGMFLRAARAAGARTAVLDRFRPAEFLDAVVATRASVFFLVPTQWYRLLELPPEARRHDLGSVRAAVVAGAPIAAAVKARIEDWLGPGKLWEFYGSSETGTITVAAPGDHAARPGSVGRPPAGTSLRLHDGEVFVRSAALMAGYLDDDGAITRLDERDGHISVGDLGQLDDGGWLTLVDRKHDTIISGGMNVHPAEVERVLAEHPAIAGAVVFGTDDPEWGQVVTALVAPRSPATSALDVAGIMAFLRGRLAGYKLPRRWATCSIAELPIGGSGKALRRAAREGFRSGIYVPLR